MPPLPPFDGRPASSAVMAIVTEGTDLSRGSVTQTGGGGVYGGGGPWPSLSSSSPSQAASVVSWSRRTRPTPAVCHRRRRSTAGRRHPPQWRPLARLIITNYQKCDCTLSSYVTVTQIIEVIIGVNRGAITKKRKRGEQEEVETRTKEATQEADNEKKTGRVVCMRLARWTFPHAKSFRLR